MPRSATGSAGNDLRTGNARLAFTAAAALVLAASPAAAETVKIGFISAYFGLNAGQSESMERGMLLYLRQHEKDLPPGVTIEILVRDDTGPNPDVAKRLAQELIVGDTVGFLAGAIFTPNPWPRRRGPPKRRCRSSS